MSRSLSFPLSRRQMLLGTGVVTLGTLVGCGGGGTSSTSAGGEAGTVLLPAGEGMTTYPLTLKTPYGETVLAERPDRVAIVGGLGELEAALALGIKPVVAPQEAKAYSYTEQQADLFSDATVIDVWADTFPIEQIAAAKPDLIVAITLMNLPDDFQRLATIAPVLAFPEKLDERDHETWKRITTSIGVAADLRSEADKAVTAAEGRVAQVAADHPEYRGKTIGLLINRGQEYGVEFVNRGGTAAEQLFGELGFATHPNAAELAAVEDGSLSLENLGLVDSDILLIAQHGGEGAPEAARQWLEASPLYQNLTAVKNGKVGFIELHPEKGLEIAWVLSYPNPLSIPWFADEVTNNLRGVA